MSSEFTGLVAVVTGAGSGIGLAVAQHFHDNGAKVYGLDLQEGSMSPYAHFITCDIGDPASVSSAFAALAKQTQVIDILANNAGVGATGTVEDASEEDEDSTPPAEHLCPIGFERMKDPVICSDGHTYERANIEKWLQEHDTSPMTNVTLQYKTLVPNIALRNLIQNPSPSLVAEIRQPIRRGSQLAAAATITATASALATASAEESSSSEEDSDEE
jgi:NAD(P)-dependent dehydrogenase (short-subunit alcohol dehydrogenase family)